MYRVFVSVIPIFLPSDDIADIQLLPFYRVPLKIFVLRRIIRSYTYDTEGYTYTQK